VQVAGEYGSAQVDGIRLDRSKYYYRTCSISMSLRFCVIESLIDCQTVLSSSGSPRAEGDMKVALRDVGDVWSTGVCQHASNWEVPN